LNCQSIEAHALYEERKTIGSLNRDNINMNSIGKEVKVNNIQFESITSAAQYICKEEPGKKVMTVKKEIRNFVNGQRPSWSMYGKYLIS